MAESSEKVRASGTDVQGHSVPWGLISLGSAVTWSVLIVFREGHACACVWTPFSTDCRLLMLVRTGLALAGVVGITSWMLALIKGPRLDCAPAALIPLVTVMALGPVHHMCISAAEATAIGDTRVIIAAENAYAVSSGGHFGTLECLARPIACVPSYPRDGPVLAPTLLHPQWGGYDRTFHPGAAVEGARSASALESFAYTATPILPGRTGVRAFCGDSTGRVCHTLGAPPRVSRGRCDMEEGSPCQPLR